MILPMKIVAVTAICCATMEPSVYEPCSQFKPAQSIALSSDVTLNYETSGTGRYTALYLHGFGASLRNWDDLRPLLPEHWRHLFLDLRGNGFSSKPRGSYSPNIHADDLADFILRLNLKNLVLIGHSYGGAVALVTLRQLEEIGESHRVIGLVLVDSAGYAAGDTFPLYHLRKPAWGEFVVHVVPPQVQARKTLEKAYYNKNTITPKVLARYTCFYGDPAWRFALLAAARDAVPQNATQVREWFRTIQVPTLIVWGREDRLIPPSHAQLFSGSIKNARVVLLERTGHVPHEESPEALATAVRSFLSSLQHE
jgi:pimeloyl-ACP methyl ester carboxylesterase